MSNTFKFVRFTEAGRQSFLDFLQETYGDLGRIDIDACESEAIRDIQSDINEGNTSGQWEVSQFKTVSRRTELFRAHLGSDVEIYGEELFEE